MDILLINHYSGSLRHGMEFRPGYLRGMAPTQPSWLARRGRSGPRRPHLKAHCMAPDKLHIAPSCIDPAEFAW